MSRDMKVKEVATRLNVTSKTVYEEIKRGALTAFKVGRAMRVTEEDLLEYIKKQKVKVA